MPGINSNPQSFSDVAKAQHPHHLGSAPHGARALQPHITYHFSTHSPPPSPPTNFPCFVFRRKIGNKISPVLFFSRTHTKAAAHGASSSNRAPPAAAAPGRVAARAALVPQSLRRPQRRQRQLCARSSSVLCCSLPTEKREGYVTCQPTRLHSTRRGARVSERKDASPPPRPHGAAGSPGIRCVHVWEIGVCLIAPVACLFDVCV